MPADFLRAYPPIVEIIITAAFIEISGIVKQGVPALSEHFGQCRHAQSAYCQSRYG